MLFNYLVAYDLKFGIEDGQRSDYMKSLKIVYAVYVFMCSIFVESDNGLQVFRHEIYIARVILLKLFTMAPKTNFKGLLHYPNI